MAETKRLNPLTPERLGGRAPDRISVDEALRRLVDAFTPLPDHERVPVLHALGRVLVEDVPADMDVPPFTNTAMDGYAVRAADVAMAAGDRPLTLRVLVEVAAGRVADRALGRGEAYRVLTGAPLPPGADAVVPYEYTDGRGFGGWTGAAGAQAATREHVVRVLRPVETGENVRYAGEDQRRGEVAVRAGSIVRPAEAGSLATLGRAEVWVYRRPRVAVLSTGDEVARIDQPLRPGQVRDANSHTLAALICHYGGELLSLGIAQDQGEAVRARLLDGVAQGADLLLTSGGVSMGDYDVIKHVLQDGGSIDFWSVDIRPGRPFAFGWFQGIPIMALPGNPVASMVTFELFARPALLRLAGHARWHKVELFATALHAITNRSGRENYLRAIVARRDTGHAEPEWVVRLTGEQGSGILTSMVKANALVRLMAGQTRVDPGDRVPVFMLDWTPIW